MNNLNEALEKITDFLKSEAKTETIIGQQFTLGEFTCVPVMSVGLGFGGGGGCGGGGGGGGGGILSPVPPRLLILLFLDTFFFLISIKNLISLIY
jgi:uncharacterized spore protein YtfJ